MVKLNIELPKNYLDEEVRDGYLVSHEMKKIWAVELDLLNQLLMVCEKYDIKMFADGGTMLGAIRHHGFIPWDDDIDIVMTREEYRKLDRVAQKEFKYPYFWQTECTDPGSMRGHAQLRNCETTGILKNEYDKKYKFNQGIFIDIFPLDNVPDDKQERKDFVDEILQQRAKAVRHAFYTSRFQEEGSGIKRVLRNLYHKYCSNTRNKAYDRFEEIMMRYDEQATDEVGKLFFETFSENCVWKTAWFAERKYVDFEMLKLPVSTCYDEIMTCFFGDWRVPVMQASTHGTVIFDTEVNYKKYINGEKEYKK